MMSLDRVIEQRSVSRRARGATENRHCSSVARTLVVMWSIGRPFNSLSLQTISRRTRCLVDIRRRSRAGLKNIVRY